MRLLTLFGSTVAAIEMTALFCNFCSWPMRSCFRCVNTPAGLPTCGTATALLNLVGSSTNLGPTQWALENKDAILMDGLIELASYLSL